MVLNSSRVVLKSHVGCFQEEILIIEMLFVAYFVFSVLCCLIVIAACLGHDSPGKGVS